MEGEVPAISISLLAELPELGRGIDRDRLECARAEVEAEVLTLERGEHPVHRLRGERGGSGLIVLGGWLIRTVDLAGRRSAALIGPGALVSVRRMLDPEMSPHFTVRWRAVQMTRLAVLDPALLTAAGPYPELAQALLERAYARIQLETVTAAMRSLVHVELRLQVLMWMSAGIWGHRTAEGLVLPVRLSHLDLSELVAGQRPSVSARLAELAARGEIVRRPDRTWLIRGEPPSVLDDLRVRGDPAP